MLIDQTLDKLRRKLLDLTRRNRLLNFKDSALSLRLHHSGSDDFFQQLCLNNRKLELVARQADTQTCQANQIQTQLSDQQLEQTCKQLIQASRTAIEETGLNLLHLAFGFLQWQAEDESELSAAPLILIPIRIERTRLNPTTNCYSYVLSYTEEDIVNNLSLAEKLDQDFGLILPTLPEELSPLEYLQQVAQLTTHKPQWQMTHDRVIGLFSFAKLLLYKDLDNQRWPAECPLTNHPLVRQILIGKDHNKHPTHQANDNLPQTHLPLVLDADSSQQNALREALWGKTSLVIEGPPGTGKSQTIANLIGAALHEGKSVLFVSEKKAALDVVKNRLNQTGLGDFCLELHSHRTQKSQLHKAINYRLAQQYPAPEQLQFELDDCLQSQQQLQAYSDIMQQPTGPNGEMLYELFYKAEHWRSQFSTPPTALDDAHLFSRQQHQQHLTLLQDIQKFHAALSNETRQAWQGFQILRLHPGDSQILQQHIEQLKQLTDDQLFFLQSMRTQGLPIGIDLAQHQALLNINSIYLEQAPSTLDSRFALRFLQPGATKLLSRLQQHSLESKQLIQATTDKLGTDWIRSSHITQALLTASEQLQQLGYGQQTLHQLQQTQQALENLQQQHQHLMFLCQQTSSLWLPAIHTLFDIDKFLRISHIIQQAPTDYALHTRPEHALPLAISIFEAAQQEALVIEQNIQQQGRLFDLALAPDADELLRLARILRTYQHASGFLSHTYRHARYSIRLFLHQASSLNTSDLVSRLEQLAKAKQQAQQLQQQAQYQRILGSLYQGINTDWPRLEKLLQWAQSLRQMLQDQTHTQALLAVLDQVHDAISQLATDINKAWQDWQCTCQQTAYQATDSLDLPTIVQQFTAHQQQLNQHLKPLQQHATPENIPIHDIFHGLQAYQSASELRDQVAQDDQLRDLLDDFRGVDTDIATLLPTAQWITQLLHQAKLEPELLCWLFEQYSPQKLQLLQHYITTSQQFWQSIEQLFSLLHQYAHFQPQHWFQCSHDDCSLEDMATILQACCASMSQLGLWADYCQALATAQQTGLRPIVQHNIEQCLAYYQAAFYSGLLNHHIQEYPELNQFNRIHQNNRRLRFHQLDQQVLQSMRQHISQQTSQNKIPEGVGSGYVREYTELALLTHELQKRKRHLPIRQLVRRASSALQALKPCFMMSPLSVSHYLEPGKIQFDLVIMDEASQLRPEDALGAVARAKQLVVVGDPKQLPPTSFFARMDNPEEAEAAIDDSESILDICLSHFPSRCLRWHYRSAHESLIEFSNQHFYDQRLLVFPSPYASHPQYGVQRHYIEQAHYHKSINQIEAETVVQAVMQHFTTTPHISLGVATFNSQQRDLILDLLERLQKQHPALEQAIRDNETETEAFFVKNLENVQGDERDVIFVSTTYGPDPNNHKVYQRFGPISGNTGWRRLNVIFTRAKQQMVLFTSLKAKDINVNETTPPGVVALHNYLQYAETKTLPNSTTHTPPSLDEFSQALQDLLLQQGYQVATHIGSPGAQLPLAVLDPERPGQYLLGIEYDDRHYHQHTSIRDRDYLRPILFQQKNWQIHNIWLPDWFKNRQQEIQRLLGRLHALQAENKKV